MNRSVPMLVLALCALVCGSCSKTKDPQAGSQTHFLADCASSCPDPYSCLCGVCTLSCTGSGDCADAHDSAQCLAPAEASSCNRAKLCDRECARDADCSALGDRFSCEDGRCRQASGGGGGDGGTAGAQGGRGGQGGMSGGGAGSSGQGGMAGAQGGNGGSTQAGSGGSGPLTNCQWPIKVGPCDAAIPRYGYDAAAGRCVQFTFGGCEANPNNFATLAECESACDGTSSGDECSTSADCTLIPVGCCSACTSQDPELFEAVSLRRRDAEIRANCPGGPPACGACAPFVFDPKWPVLHARCTAGRCERVDLRKEMQTACASNDECTVRRSGCCAPCSDDPPGWVAMRTDISSVFPGGVDCGGVACPECVGSPPPGSFCADDGHCAIRETARVAGAPSSTCFSPNQNLDDAYEVGAVGCDCSGNSSGASVCRADSTGRDVSLTCDSSWRAVEDGACAPGP